MKTYQIKVVVKKTKPPVWWRLIIPANITFSSLAAILSTVISEKCSDFTFEYYNRLDLYEATDLRPLKPKNWQYSSREASNTFISDYFDDKSNVSFITASGNYRIEIEKTSSEYELTFPILLKSTAENGEEVSELLESDFVIDKEDCKFKKIDEIIASKANGKIVINSFDNPKSAGDNTALSTVDLAQSSAHIFNKMFASVSVEGSVANQPVSYFLGMYSLFDLRDKADELNIPYSHALTHKELVEKLSSFILDEKNMSNLLLPFFDYEIQAFERLIDNPGYRFKKSEQNDIVNFRWALMAFKMQNGTCFVPKDVAEVYKRIDGKKMDSERAEARRIIDICECIIPPYYGIIPERKFTRLCARSKNPKISADEVLPLFNRINPNFNFCKTIGGDIVANKLEESGQLKALKQIQEGKPLYLLTTDELEEILKYDYPKSDKGYAQLKNWLNNHTDDKELAELLLIETHSMVAFCYDLDEIFQNIIDNCFSVDENSLQNLANILMRVSNNTRTHYNRGYTPNEMSRLFPPKNKPPVIVPMSSAAADMMKQAEHVIKKHGAILDMDSTAVTVNSSGKRRKKNKIYPNDPCPCGSGKKYKKCCGR